MKTKLFSILLLLALFTTACGATNTSAPTAEPALEEIPPNTITAEGTLLPSPSVELAFAQGGVVSEILAGPGELLATGDVIAQLVGIETVQAELAAAQFELVGAQQALDELLETEAKARAHALINLDRAEEDYDKAEDYYESLFKPYKYYKIGYKYIYTPLGMKRIPVLKKVKMEKGDDEAIADAEEDLALKLAQLEEAERAYERVKDGPDMDQLALLEARLNAADAHVTATEAAAELYELRAPFNGILLSLDLTVGESVTPTLPIAFLADTSRWIVETKDLAEIDVAHITIDDPVIIQLDAFPGEEFTAKVTAIDTVGREYLGDMTYKVTATLDESDPRFMWNMTATVNIDVE